MDAGNALSLDRFSGLLRLLFGPIVWAIHFTIIYGTHTLACVLGGAGVATLIVLIATIAALILLAILMLGSTGMRRRRSAPTETVPLLSFTQAVTALLALLSAIAVAWAGAAALVVAPCGSPD